MKDFRNLTVWQKAHQLTLAVYSVTQQFPSDERYGLTSQIRRAATSIPTNIAEGCGYGSDAELKRFLQIAMGSASEVDYQLLLARDLKFISPQDYQPLAQQIDEIKRMLATFIKKLRADIKQKR